MQEADYEVAVTCKLVSSAQERSLHKMGPQKLADEDHVYGSSIVFDDGSSVSSIAGSGEVTFDAGPLNPDDSEARKWTNGKSFKVLKTALPS